MGHRLWLARVIESDYLPMLGQLEDSPTGRSQAEQLAMDIREGWAQRGSKTLAQQQGLMDQTRRAIKDVLGAEHFSLDYINFTKEEYTQLNDAKQGNVARRNESQQFLDNPDGIVAKAVRLLDSPEWAEVAAGLSLLTGRRCSEILSTAKFQPKSKWSVVFTGALKRRGEPQELSFEIPTLTTAQKVCRALEKVRQELPQAAQMSASQVNSSFSQAVIRACDRHFADLIPTRDGKDNLYTHLFRSVYATIATFWYCPPNVEPTEFKAAIQGHYAILDEKSPTLKRSLSASRHYSDYEIADSVIAYHKGKRKGIKLGLAGVQPLEIFQLSMQPKSQERSQKRLRSSIRVWQEDRPLLDELFNRLEIGEGTQQDRMSQFLVWAKECLDKQALERSQQPQNESVQEGVSGMEEGVEAPETEESVSLEPEVQEVMLVSSAVEGKLDKLLDVMTQFVQLQLNPETIDRALEKRKSIREKAQVSREEDGSGEEEQPRQRTRSSDMTERINNTIDAIMDHNNAPDRLHDDKWAITINALKSFGFSQRAIQKILDHRQDEINQHHLKHQIDPAKHNHRHRRKLLVTQAIDLP